MCVCVCGPLRLCPEPEEAAVPLQRDCEWASGNWQCAIHGDTDDHGQRAPVGTRGAAQQEQTAARIHRYAVIAHTLTIPVKWGDLGLKQGRSSQPSHPVHPEVLSEGFTFRWWGKKSRLFFCNLFRPLRSILTSFDNIGAHHQALHSVSEDIFEEKQLEAFRTCKLMCRTDISVCVCVENTDDQECPANENLLERGIFWICLKTEVVSVSYTTVGGIEFGVRED